MALSTLGAQFVDPGRYLQFWSWFLEAADVITNLWAALSGLETVGGFGTL